MQLVFTSNTAQESGVSVNSEKYEKLVVDGYYSRSLWAPIKADKKDADGFPTNFGVVVTREKGTVMLVEPKPGKTDDRLLLVGQVWGGFRGGASVVGAQTTGKILWSTTSSKHCKGCVSLAAVLGEGQKLTTHSVGRRHDEYIVFSNLGGSLKKEVFQGDEYTALIDSSSEEYDEV